MSTAPLDRDEQIKLMQNAASRFDSRVQKWKESGAISRVLRKPNAKLSEASEYARSDEKIARYG